MIKNNIITVKMWKDITTFDPLANGNFDVDGTVKRIVDITGKSVEEVETMPISDLLPEFLNCVKLVNAEVFDKLKQLKNGSGDREA